MSPEVVTSPNRKRPFFAAIWTFFFLLAAAGCLLKAAPWNPQASPPTSAPQQALVADVAGKHVPYTPTPIELIQVGQRVLTHNPRVGDGGRNSEETIVPQQWSKISLRMTKLDGARLDIELLRPEEWLEGADADEGAQVDLDMPEFGVVGLADVISIKPCPEILPGAGKVVTGTFRHSSGDILDLFLRGRDKPVGVTAGHRIWSADRGAFVEARELLAGEKLGSLDMLAEVAAVRPRCQAAPVFNLEVEIDHTYYADGLLVHNSCVGLPKSSIGLGKWGERKFEHVLAGAGEAHVRLVTSGGPRIIDRLFDGVAYEAKAGLNVQLTSRLWTQALKDAELVRAGKIDAAQWYFFRGASAETVKALKQLGIGVHVF